jgi:hypothetical protein|tara:strand:+ start:2311 stop:2907 length:597 start_codon:yes stop_codon:yes gene_type:complete
MKWFKHDSTASMDAKLKRLRLKYGMEGYGVYWYLLECVARTVEPHNLTFELEEDAELIAAEINIHRDRVEEMMRFMCELGLFENAQGRITCLKMSSRSDEYTVKLMRQNNVVRINSGVDQEKIPPNRKEEKRKIQRKTTIPSDFSISDQVRDWALRNGHGSLNQHLDHFVDRAVAKGYTYVNWDAAFKEAVRKNWAGL